MKNVHKQHRSLSKNSIDLSSNELILLFRYWLAPIGKSLGIKSTKAKPPIPNQLLEDAYNKSQKLNHKTVSALSHYYVLQNSPSSVSIIGTSSLIFFCAIILGLVFNAHTFAIEIPASLLPMIYSVKQIFFLAIFLKKLRFKSYNKKMF